MQTINFNLSTKLNKLGLLNNIETEFVYDTENSVLPKWVANNIDIKTLTTEEAIEFLRNNNHFLLKNGHLNIASSPYMWGVNYIKWTSETTYENLCKSTTGKTLLEAIEKMIVYLLDDNLLDNNLLTK